MKQRAILSWKQLCILSCLLLSFAGLTVFLFQYHRDEKTFERISSQLFAEELADNTLNMHYTLAYPADFGIYDYEPSLPCYSADGRQESQDASRELLLSLEKLEAGELSPANRRAYALLLRSLKNTWELNRFPYYGEPLAPSSGMQSQLPILLAEYTFRTRRDVEDYLALLDQTDEYLLSLLTYEQEKAEAGLLLPAESLDRVKRQCDTILTREELDAGQHFLQTTFVERLLPLIQNGSLTQEEALAYRAQNDRLLKTVTLPAYEALADGLFLLEDETIPLCGLAARPNGREYYRCLLISETGSYREIDEIEQLLLNRFYDEYNAIRALYRDHPKLRDPAVYDAIADFPISGTEAMLADLQGRMAQDFPQLPAADGAGQTDVSASDAAAFPSATIKAVSPSLEEYSAPAFYLTAPMDDTDNNVIYINQKNLPDGLELYTTLAHEGYPGHLYQTVYHNRTFLRRQENPARELLWYGGYTEGWALYVEFCAFDYAAAVYTEQGNSEGALLTQLEQHNRSLQLCLYCLLDLMIHYENISYEQVGNILRNVGITEDTSIRSVYTYLVEEPCNYLKYYLGYLEVLELKKEAAGLWGDGYSDLRFHTFYLDSGPADFTTLREWLAQA